MARFLHTADWQIGRHYSRFAADDAAALSEARFAAVETLAQLARDESCDAVLVAGDIFDAQTVSDRIIRRLFNSLTAFNGPWVMLPGNHDAALAESVWTRAKRLQAVPENVHLALESAVIELQNQGIAILAAPLTQRHTYEDLTAAFDNLETTSGLIRVGLAHGSVQGILAEEIDSSNPIAADRAERSQLDYLALGDWHGVKQISARTWYSGAPEPERFRNNEAGFALWVEIAGPGALPNVRAHAIGQYQWQQLQLSFAVPTDVDDFLRVLESASTNAVLDVHLQGEVTLADEARLIQALSITEARVRSLHCDRQELALVPTEEDIAALQADGYLGEVIQELRDLQVNKGDQVARDALGILSGLLRERQVEVQG